MREAAIVLFEKTLVALALILAFEHAGRFWIAYPLMLVAILSALKLPVQQRVLWIAGDRANVLFYPAFPSWPSPSP
jgi:hypothetical protein